MPDLPLGGFSRLVHADADPGDCTRAVVNQWVERVPAAETAVAQPPHGQIVTAPWSDDQVASLRAFQSSEAVHPFTCGHCPRFANGEPRVLCVGREGFHCFNCRRMGPQWAHRFMADWSWRKLDVAACPATGRASDAPTISGLVSGLLVAGTATFCGPSCVPPVVGADDPRLGQWLVVVDAIMYGLGGYALFRLRPDAAVALCVRARAAGHAESLCLTTPNGAETFPPEQAELAVRRFLELE